MKYFCMIFQWKCSLFNTLSIGKVSISYLFSFSRYQTKCVIKFLFIQLMMSQTLRFIFDQPLQQWRAERKRGEDENTKIWVSRQRKNLFRWNKNHFLLFLKGYHLVRNTNLIKNSGHKLHKELLKLFLNYTFFLHFYNFLGKSKNVNIQIYTMIYEMTLIQPFLFQN